ncbi:MAG: DMT family transporter, partial [Deltaproteobacteria bacterium]|nr:DMT family transporter [Deltaproteobacteria bacterium]
MLEGVPYLGELFSLAAALVWAVAIILFRQSGRHFQPVALNLFKDVLGLVLFLLTLLVLGIPLLPEGVSARDWLFLLGSGVLGIGLADTLFFASLNRLGAGYTAIVDCVYSPFVVLVAVLFLHEPLRPSLLLALGLVVCAILLGSEQQAAAGRDGERTPRWREERDQLWLGVVLGVLSVLLMACGIVLAKPVLERVDPWWAATVRLVGGLCLLLPQAALRANRAGVLQIFRPGPGWWVTVPGALLGTYLAMIVWICGMKYTFASVASVLNQTSTLFVLLLATVFLREALTPRRV